MGAAATTGMHPVGWAQWCPQMTRRPRFTSPDVRAFTD